MPFRTANARAPRPGRPGEPCGSVSGSRKPPVEHSISGKHPRGIVDEQQIRNTNLAEVLPDRVNPEARVVLRIANSDVTGGTVSGVEAGEQAEGGSQALLAVTAFPLDGIARQGRHGRRGLLHLRLPAGHGPNNQL